ncbi:MAG: hypothetical protein ACYDA0_01435 [Candidatus Dormibacteraceae bacterium]
MINDVAVKNRDIAMVFQSYVLYPLMSVYGQHGLPAPDAAHEPDIDKRVEHASGGLDSFFEVRLPKPVSATKGTAGFRPAMARSAATRSPRASIPDEGGSR